MHSNLLAELGECGSLVMWDEFSADQQWTTSGQVTAHTDVHSSGMLENSERSGTERNRTGSNWCTMQYGRRRWTRGQKLALIRTVCVCVRTKISRSVTGTKTGQAPVESHVKRMNFWGRIQPTMGSVMSYVSLQVLAQCNRKRVWHSALSKQALAQAK